MNRSRIFALAACGLLLSAPALGQIEFALPPGQTSYRPLRIGAGKDRLVQFLPAQSRGPAPIVIMLDEWSKPGRRHDEATRGLSAMLRARGIAFALIPADRFAKDGGSEVAQAIAVLRARAADLNIDMDRVALLGEGLGASFAALLATDPVRARAAGLDVDRIRAAVLLDGACYDVEQCLALASPRARPGLADLWPTDEAGRRSASPISHAAPPNARSFFIHFDAGSNVRAEGEAMLKALRDAGQPVTASSAAMRFDQGGPDRLDRARPNANSPTMLDYLAEQLQVP